MSVKKIQRDERTDFIENKSYKYGYNILNFGILIYIVYRAIRFNQDLGGLLGLVLITGFITTVYQYTQKRFTIKGDKLFSFLFILSAVIGTTVFIFMILT